MQLAGAIVVEDLRKDDRVAVKEELVQYWVVVNQGFGESGQSRRWDLLQSRLVRLVAYTADVQYDPVFRVAHRSHGLDANPLTHRGIAAAVRGTPDPVYL